jgi:hypothetical protein
MAKIVTMIIDEEGNPMIDLAGYQGKGCAAIQEAFGRALGTTVEAVKKPEYHRAPVNKHTVKQ